MSYLTHFHLHTSQSACRVFHLFLTASRDPPYFILCTLLFVCSATSLSSVFSILLTRYYNIAYPLNKLHFPCFTRASPLHSLVVSHKHFTHCTLHPASSVSLTNAPSAVLSSQVSVLLSANSFSTYRNSFYTLILHTSHVSTMQYPQVSTLFPLYFLCSSFCILYNVCRMLCSLPSPTLAILPSILCSHSPCLIFSVFTLHVVLCSFPFPVLNTVALLILQYYPHSPVTPSAPISSLRNACIIGHCCGLHCPLTEFSPIVRTPVLYSIRHSALSILSLSILHTHRLPRSPFCLPFFSLHSLFHIFLHIHSLLRVSCPSHHHLPRLLLRLLPLYIFP